MSDNKDEKYLASTPISKEIYPGPTPSKEIYPEPIPEEEKYFNPEPMPDSSLFGELPDGYQINEFGEIVRENGKSR